MLFRSLFADFSGDGPDIAILREGEACAPFVVHGPELDAVRDWISDAERRIVRRTRHAGSHVNSAAKRRNRLIPEAKRGEG